MAVENENGELRQLLEIKRTYRRNLMSLEEELKAKYERELADGKKRLKEEYLESVVDVVFAEPAPPSPSPPAPVEETKLEPASEMKQPGVCPECDAPVGPDDKFCAKCAFPLKEEVKDEAPVVSAGRRIRARVRR